ncbi:hypothetical protein ZWY2020_016292 [Hordeum vulgare]|nr:hypothetical protein ZWY2020_016292 [Hordeum vulgare]
MLASPTIRASRPCKVRKRNISDLRGQAIQEEENFLFSSKEENSPLKVIDFGLSDFVKPDERLNDIVGSAYYVAPEVLHRSYGTEGDMWSIGVITYILLCGSRPFWVHTESGIFRAVLKAEPRFDETTWPTLSAEAKDFVKRSPMDPRCTTSEDSFRYDNLQNYESLYQFIFIAKVCFEVAENGKWNWQAMVKNSTDAMNDSKVIDFVTMVCTLQYKKLDFEEFAASAIGVYQMEALETWEQHARRAYELFDTDDEEAPRWAALEKLPTYDRARTAVLAMPEGEIKEVNRDKLGAQQRITLVGDDHECFLSKFKDLVHR